MFEAICIFFGVVIAVLVVGYFVLCALVYPAGTEGEIEDQEGRK